MIDAPRLSICPAPGRPGSLSALPDGAGAYDALHDLVVRVRLQS